MPTTDEAPAVEPKAAAAPETLPPMETLRLAHLASSVMAAKHRQPHFEALVELLNDPLVGKVIAECNTIVETFLEPNAVSKGFQVWAGVLGEMQKSVPSHVEGNAKFIAAATKPDPGVTDK